LSIVELNIYITSQPSRLGNIVTSMTRHLHRAAVKLP
jgi:hypothetical protein